MLGVVTLLVGLAAQPGPEIQLYTMGEGQNVWERYGHAALCVRYSPGQGQDACYNWGTFDFTDQAKMALGILREEPVFWVSARPPHVLLSGYRRFDRTIWRQVLPLSPSAKAQLVAELKENILPENRRYVYNYISDNCSTRIRDIISRFLPGTLSERTEPMPYTYRDMVRKGVADSRLTLALIDFFVGRSVDRSPTAYESALLPTRLRVLVEQELGVKPEVLYERKGPPLRTTPLPHSFLFMLVALAIGFPIWAASFLGRFRRVGLWISVLLLFVVSVVLWTLAAVSSIDEFRYNEVLLLFLPTDLLLLTRWRKAYALLRLASIALVSLLAALGVLVQPLFVIALIPTLTMIEALRSDLSKVLRESHY